MSIMQQSVPTIECESFPLEDEYKFQPFDIVFERSGNPRGHVALGMVLAGPISIPYFEDGCASGYAFKPLDIKNPDEWKMGWTAYVVSDFVRQDVCLVPARSLTLLKEEPTSGYIPFDQGTAQLRIPLGLIELADKFYQNSKERSILSSNLKGYG